MLNGYLCALGWLYVSIQVIALEGSHLVAGADMRRFILNSDTPLRPKLGTLKTPVYTCLYTIHVNRALRKSSSIMIVFIHQQLSKTPRQFSNQMCRQGGLLSFTPPACNMPQTQKIPPPHMIIRIILKLDSHEMRGAICGCICCNICNG
jgi:hypothetical protein